MRGPDIYQCPACRYRFSEADPAWGTAVNSGQCPCCGEPFRAVPAHPKEEAHGLAYPGRSEPASLEEALRTDFASSPFVQDAGNERTASLAAKFWWVGFANNAGAVITSFWFLSLVFREHGILSALGVFVLLGFFIYPIGTAPLFAVSASALHFGYNVVGVWLPVVSYITAASALVAPFLAAWWLGR